MKINLFIEGKNIKQIIQYTFRGKALATEKRFKNFGTDRFGFSISLPSDRAVMDGIHPATKKKNKNIIQLASVRKQENK